MIDSVKTIFWASLLLLMLLYVCGILCTRMIGKNRTVGYHRQINTVPEDEISFHPDFDAHQFFGAVPRAMFTLFETSLGPLNIRPVIERQPYMMPFFLFFLFDATRRALAELLNVPNNLTCVSFSSRACNECI